MFGFRKHFTPFLGFCSVVNYPIVVQKKSTISPIAGQLIRGLIFGLRKDRSTGKTGIGQNVRSDCPLVHKSKNFRNKKQTCSFRYDLNPFIVGTQQVVTSSCHDAVWARCIEGSPHFGHKWKLLALLGGIFMKEFISWWKKLNAKTVIWTTFLVLTRREPLLAWLQVIHVL